VPPYRQFFESVTGHRPFPYQERLGVEPWPDLVDVPTGLGKTAAVVVAWLWKHSRHDRTTPRRLVYCLPMRVLVEQTLSSVESWLNRARPVFEESGIAPPASFVLLGGRAEDDWARHPEHPAILVGTQDMLLSRALMRGYGASRFRWPIDFGLLHSDVLWAFDEVQLLGPGLATSAQLEAFRRAADMPPARPSRSLWLSATLRPDWLETVDFAPHTTSLGTLRLSDEEKALEPVRQRVEAPKALQRAGFTLEAVTKGNLHAYADALASLTLERHDGTAPTLVILNSVERAQSLAKRLLEQAQATEIVVVHARFRQKERAALNGRIRHIGAKDDVIVVATQAVEAGVDLNSRTLITELAPWSSMVQRFGRCNRDGKVDGAEVLWIDLVADADESVALPYTAESLETSREILHRLDSAAPAHFPPFEEHAPIGHVLRRRDFIELFNTDPDLSGFDIDVSPYIRDTGTPQVQVFWREFDDAPGEQPSPLREELCPVSLGQIRTHLSKKGVVAYRHDHLEPDPERRWRRLGRDRARPGEILLLRRSDGGYDERLGFVAGHGSAPAAPTAITGDHPSSSGIPDEPATTIGRFVPLTEHLSDAVSQASDLCDSLDEPRRTVIVQSLRWHDVGKAHPAFQNALLAQARDGEAAGETLWAKSSGTGRLVYTVERGGREQERKFFRHELVSALAWLEHGERREEHDLVAFLIAAHHGKVRMGIRSLPGETQPTDDRLFARGVWEGDRLSALEWDGVAIPETKLRLSLMQLGDGDMGPSWTSRTRQLLEQHGPFQLAWLEALVRIADWRASERQAAVQLEAQ